VVLLKSQVFCDGTLCCTVSRSIEGTVILWSVRNYSHKTQCYIPEDLNLHLHDFSPLAKLSESVECKMHHWPVIGIMACVNVILPNGCSHFKKWFYVCVWQNGPGKVRRP
jgi:hypothetical protein